MGKIWAEFFKAIFGAIWFFLYPFLIVVGFLYFLTIIAEIFNL